MTEHREAALAEEKESNTTATGKEKVNKDSKSRRLVRARKEAICRTVYEVSRQHPYSPPRKGNLALDLPIGTRPHANMGLGHFNTV